MSRLQKGKISALDTETIGGYAVILSTEHRTWEAHSFEECVRPIFHDISDKKIGGRILMWNQGYDAQAILKYLPDENVWELINDNETEYKQYSIHYVRGKFLRIQDHKLQKTMSGYDLAQFFNYMKLDKAAEEFLGERKIDNEVTKEITTRARYHTDNELYWIFAHNLEEIKRYCMQDAALTQKLGVYLSDLIFEMYSFRMNSFAARTVIGKELIKRKCTVNGKVCYPQFKEDSGAGKFAGYAYHGGIFDCKQRGSFKDITNVDISSAYPHHMRNLPNWSNGDFIQISPLDLKKSDYYGWVFVSFDYPLIPYTTELLNEWVEDHAGEEEVVIATNPRKFYPTGERSQVITLLEYWFLKKHGYPAKLYGGFVWRHNPDKPQYPKPFGWIDRVYKMKQEVKDKYGSKDFRYSLTKIPLNSAYGTTAQNKGYALYRNLFYASYITAATRVQICEMLEELPEDADSTLAYDRYIGIATDGIMLKGHVELPHEYTKGGLGSWDVDYWDKAIILANGIYRLEREGEKPKQALRGMLSYDGNMKEAITEHKDESDFIPSTKERPVTMYQSMRWKKYTRDDMNRFVPIGRKLSCNTDTTKHWGRIETFGNLLDSTYIGRRFNVGEINAMAPKKHKVKT